MAIVAPVPETASLLLVVRATIRSIELFSRPQSEQLAVGAASQEFRHQPKTFAVRQGLQVPLGPLRMFTDCKRCTQCSTFTQCSRFRVAFITVMFTEWGFLSNMLRVVFGLVVRCRSRQRTVLIPSTIPGCTERSWRWSWRSFRGSCTSRSRRGGLIINNNVAKRPAR